MDSARVYLDTSAYLGILLGEAPARPFLKVLEKKILCSSVLLLIEAERNLVRMSREGDLPEGDYRKTMDQLKDDREKFLLKDLTLEICFTGVFPPVKIPRSSDLVHLRTARWFQENGGLAGFLSLDKAQKEAAQDFELPVLTI